MKALTHALWLLPVAAFFIGRTIRSFDATPAESSPAASAQTLATTHSPAAAPNSRTAPTRPARSAFPSTYRPTAKEALSLPSRLHRLAAFAHYLETATAADLAALYQEWWPSGNEFSDGKYDLYFEIFFSRWTQLDPEGAMATLIRLKGKHLAGAMDAWAAQDPDAALAWLDRNSTTPGLNGGELRSVVLEHAVPKPGQLPPLEALRKIRALREGSKDSKNADGTIPLVFVNSTAMILREWAQRDPEAAWKATLESPEIDERSRASSVSNVLGTMAGKDLPRARECYDALPPGKLKDAAAQTLVHALAYHRSPAAREFALGLPEGPSRQRAIEYLGDFAAQKPGGLGAFITSLPPSETQELTRLGEPTPVGGLMSRWFFTDPAQAGEFLKSRLPADLQATDAQKQIYASMFSPWISKDPRAAAEYLLELPESVRTGPLNNALRNMAAKNPAETAQWIATTPESPARDQMFAKVAEHWSKQGTTGVTTWLNSLPASSSKSAAVESFSRQVISTSPDDALAWLHSLPNDSDRLPRLQRVWRTWTDRDSAQRWRDTNPQLTPAERAALTEP